MAATSLYIDPSAVRAALKKRAQVRYALAIGQIALGLVSTVMIPVVAAAFCLIGLDRMGGWGGGGWNGRPSSLDWWEWFAILLVLFMPIAYVLEWRTQGGFLMRKLMEIENSDGGWYEAVTKDRTWRWGAREGAAQWEILLFAPRQVFAGFARLRGMRQVALVDPTRAAEVLAVLASQEHGVPVERLRRPGEDTLAFGRILSYLLFYDWVGAGENGQKIWALTEAREDLGVSVHRQS